MKAIVTPLAAILLVSMVASAWSGSLDQDPLAQSEVWAGQIPGPKNRKDDIELRIHQNNRGIFLGELAFIAEDGSSKSYAVEGITAGNAVRFMSDRHGTFQIFFTGRVKGDKLDLTYTGTNRFGNRTQGSVALKPKQQEAAKQARR